MAIEAYVARHVAPATRVLHEIESEIVHVDVHVVPPASARPFWFLFTTGMSALPMRVPHGMGLVAHAELALMLPDGWQIDPARWQRDPRWFWPIRELVATARYPHLRRTWLGEGHTLASADPPRPLDPTTEFCGMLLVPCGLDDSDSTVIDAAVATELFALWPLHADELDFKRAHGACALLERLDAAGATAVFDPDRPSCVPVRGTSAPPGTLPN